MKKMTTLQLTVLGGIASIVLTILVIILPLWTLLILLALWLILPFLVRRFRERNGIADKTKEEESFRRGFDLVDKVTVVALVAIAILAIIGYWLY